MTGHSSKEAQNAYMREYRKRMTPAQREREAAWKRRWREANREQDLENKRWSRRKIKYGVTKEMYDEMLVRQGGLCAVCRVAEPTHIDHDHATGQVRSLLCAKCNRGLGHFDDDPERLRQAAEYVESARFGVAQE